MHDLGPVEEESFLPACGPSEVNPSMGSSGPEMRDGMKITIPPTM